MGRLRRFPDHRYIGIRDDMVVYDCDDDDQYRTLGERIENGDLMRRCRLQAFAPDAVAEARNRGFRPPR